MHLCMYVCACVCVHIFCCKVRSLPTTKMVSIFQIIWLAFAFILFYGSYEESMRASGEGTCKASTCQYVLLSSCKEIKEKSPGSKSGYYTIMNETGDPLKVYCNMDELCGSGGGWKRVALLDMTDANQDCPDGLRLYDQNGVRACGRPVSSSGSCASIQFPSDGLSYSEVCGKVIGYQYASPSGTDRMYDDINSYYIDGVSLTHGSPRQHIWTFMAQVEQNVAHGNNNIFICPCAPGSTANKAPFIGDDYYCEAGSTASWEYTLYTEDPLWDGEHCGPIEQGCCEPGMPWFHKALDQPTTDYIELRVCADQDTNDEDAPVSQYEIYVR